MRTYRGRKGCYNSKWKQKRKAKNNKTDYNGNNDQSRTQYRIRDHKKDTRNEYFTGEESNVGASLGLITQNMNLKANFDVFIKKLENYMMQTCNKPGDVVVLVRDMEDPKINFQNKQTPKDLTEDQEKSRLQKIIQEQRIKVFVTREIDIKYNLK